MLLQHSSSGSGLYRGQLLWGAAASVVAAATAAARALASTGRGWNRGTMASIGVAAGFRVNPPAGVQPLASPLTSPRWRARQGWVDGGRGLWHSEREAGKRVPHDAHPMYKVSGFRVQPIPCMCRPAAAAVKGTRAPATTLPLLFLCRAHLRSSLKGNFALLWEVQQCANTAFAFPHWGAPSWEEPAAPLFSPAYGPSFVVVLRWMCRERDRVARDRAGRWRTEGGGRVALAGQSGRARSACAHRLPCLSAPAVRETWTPPGRAQPPPPPPRLGSLHPSPL
eukprot:272150-Chlamydomonas_euryale.AAC.2